MYTLCEVGMLPGPAIVVSQIRRDGLNESEAPTPFRNRSLGLANGFRALADEIAAHESLANSERVPSEYQDY